MDTGILLFTQTVLFIPKVKVCVIGAGGFVASWLVNVCLKTVGSPKYEHLLKLDKAYENLTLFKADILDYESVYSAIVGCSAVFHAASPVPSTVVPNPEVTFLMLSYMQTNLICHRVVLVLPSS
ncbi:cinnamoyl-CoA reductase, putative [Medicago truncatula]|uniref:Cinnamoyl-CoA reductase, putative n=1 Tax=Medicago truncatula TaxID=3880 RepID=G7LEQ3_MEDTR|nr:cinnamoyl-CoA reductase, putative [Medicago truncatula]